MNKLIAAALVCVFLLSGCTGMRNMMVEDMLKDTNQGTNPQKVKGYEEKLAQVLDDVGDKEDYKKLPLDGEEDAKWFTNESFLLWDKQQTKETFVSNGLKKFPEYKTTLEYLAEEFTK